MKVLKDKQCYESKNNIERKLHETQHRFL